MKFKSLLKSLKMFKLYNLNDLKCLIKILNEVLNLNFKWSFKIKNFIKLKSFKKYFQIIFRKILKCFSVSAAIQSASEWEKKRFLYIHMNQLSKFRYIFIFLFLK